MKLFLSDQKLFNVNRVPPLVQKVKAFLDASKNGELFTVHQVAAAVHSTFDSVRGKTTPFLEGYYQVHAGKKYYGKKATINQLRHPGS
jgi:hypothetical protein